MPLFSSIVSSTRPHQTSNVYLWATFIATALGIGLYFVFHVHRSFTPDTALAVVGLLARTTFYVSVGVLVEAFLLRTAGGYLTLTPLRRAVLHAGWVSLLLVCVSLLVDLVVFSFAGYHVTTAIEILFSDGPGGVAKVIDAAGLPLSLVALGGVGLAAATAAAGWLSRAAWRRSAGTRLSISRRAALVAALVSLGGIALVETVGYRVRDPFLWEREVRTVPLAFAVVRPAAELASFAVPIRPHDIKEKRALAAAISPSAAAAGDGAARRPDIFVVVMESLRKEILSPEVMPRLHAFARSGWTFEHPVTTGNVTHYSWYGMFCGEHPLYFDVVKKNPSEQGSVPIGVLRRLGYRINLLATPDTAYQNLEAVVFGPGGALLDTRFHPPDRSPAARDKVVVDEVARRIEAEPRGGQFTIVALDSTHFDYAWGPQFEPPFRPFAADPSISRNYEQDDRARLALYNRYRNAAAWMDTLVGRLIDALSASGRLQDSIIIFTADHGESFWEHGVGSHGSDLGTEQLEVVLAMRLPGEAPRRFDGVFSLLDLMPTILAHLGVDEPRLFAGVPVQKRIGEGGKLARRAVLSFQGWNARAFKFALSDEHHRVQLELDHADPARSRRLLIKGMTDLAGRSLLEGERPGDPGFARVTRELPGILADIPFLPR